MRELATSVESLSAQQFYELLDESCDPQFGRLRAFLRENDRTLVYQERRVRRLCPRPALPAAIAADL
jgi:hypothetical protein